jgi:mannosyltransferase OCH1-like enzyme
MSIDSIDVDLDCVWSLEEWLQSEDAQTVQRQLEERITKIFFSHDPESPAFQMMAVQLAWGDSYRHCGGCDRSWNCGCNWI